MSGSLGVTDPGGIRWDIHTNPSYPGAIQGLKSAKCAWFWRKPEYLETTDKEVGTLGIKAGTISL